MLLTELEIVWNMRLGPTIWPKYLHAVFCLNAMMEPKQNQLKKPFVESGVFLHGCNNGMTFLFFFRVPPNISDLMYLQYMQSRICLFVGTQP